MKKLITISVIFVVIAACDISERVEADYRNVIPLPHEIVMVAGNPFVIEKDKVATIIGVIFGLGILAFFIWITQWIFGLIPVILNRAYINYVLQLGLNLVPIVALTIGSIKEAKRKKLS